MARVVIVGAGPGGAGLAQLLAHRGVDVALLERQRDFAREFRGEVLMPSGVEALEQIGVGRALGGLPQSRPEVLGWYLNRRRVVELALEPERFEGRMPCAVSQPALLELLVSEGAKSGRLRFERGASVKSLLRRHDRMVGVRVRTSAGDEELLADLVVGADGRASVVRRQAEIKSSSHDLPMDVVWCKLPCPESFRGARVYVGRGHLLICYRNWDGRLQVAWVILKGTYGELRRRGIGEWVDEMASHLSPDLAAHFREQRDAVQQPFLLDTQSDCVAHWSVPGALLIGDAAHTMSPVGGQGLNIALRDAIVAANHLVPVLQAASPDPARVDAALRAVEVERMPEIESVQQLQAQPPRLVLSRSWWAEPLRRALALLARTPVAQRAAAGVLQTFLSGVTRVRLRV